VIAKAKEKLRQLENNSSREFSTVAHSGEPEPSDRKNQSEQPVQQYSLFLPEADNPAVEQLKALDIDNLTPRQALQQLYELKELLQ
jgi:DNA mismatch repair protein MutS